MAAAKKPSDGDRIDAIIEVLKANGLSLPDILDPKPDDEPADED